MSNALTLKTLNSSGVNPAVDMLNSVVPIIDNAAQFNPMGLMTKAFGVYGDNLNTNRFPVHKTTPEEKEELKKKLDDQSVTFNSLSNGAFYGSLMHAANFGPLGAGLMGAVRGFISGGFKEAVTTGLAAAGTAALLDKIPPESQWIAEGIVMAGSLGADWMHSNHLDNQVETQTKDAELYAGFNPQELVAGMQNSQASFNEQMNAAAQQQMIEQAQQQNSSTMKMR